MVPWADNESFSKWHLDQSSHFCRAHLYSQRDTQTTLCVISVAIGCIYTMYVVQPKIHFECSTCLSSMLPVMLMYTYQQRSSSLQNFCFINSELFFSCERIFYLRYRVLFCHHLFFCSFMC